MTSKDDRNGSGPGLAPPARSTGTGPTSEDPWSLLRHEVETCTRCPLHRSRTHTVFYRGGRRPRVVFVGEAPGAEEDRTGLPFVGRAGRRLDSALITLPLTADEYGILNLVKCRPPENRFDLAAARTCRPYLDRQLALLGPNALVSLGRHALHAIDPDAPPILQCAGQPRRAGGRDLFPLLHPSAIRSTALARRWDEDIRGLGRWLDTAVPAFSRESL